MSPGNDPLAIENIQLDYRLRVHYPLAGDHESTYIADGAEVFLDEHQVQWIKFFPKNGQYAGEEHLLRTDQIYLTRISS